MCKWVIRKHQAWWQNVLFSVGHQIRCYCNSTQTFYIHLHLKILMVCKVVSCWCKENSTYTCIKMVLQLFKTFTSQSKVQSRGRQSMARLASWIWPTLQNHQARSPFANCSKGVLTKRCYIPHTWRQLDARKLKESSQDRYLSLTLAGAFSKTSRQDKPWSMC